MSTNKNPFNVKPGQIWREVDPRFKREARVRSVLNGKAFLETVGTGRSTTASLTRFHGKRGGYVLVTP